jgi:cytochrome P450
MTPPTAATTDHTSSNAAATGAPARPLRTLDQLPGPRGIPVLGNMLQIDRPRFHQQCEQWCKEYGTYFTIRLGRAPMLITSDHEAFAAVMRDRPDGFRRTTRTEQVAAEMGLKPGVFGAYGETWKRQRRMVMAGFDPAHVKRYYPSLLKVGMRLAGRWDKAAASNASIELQADLMRFTVDTIAGLAFGSEVNTLESAEDVIQNHLDTIFPALYRRMFSAFPLWRYFKREADRELERAIPQVNAAVDGFIAQARARMQADPSLRTHPHNLLEAMVAAADEPGSGIDDEQVAGNVMTMLLAGEDTTANTLAWMIHLLWLNPQARERAIAEVRNAVGDCSNPSLEQIQGLDYIEACAHETMRLKPVAPQLPLQALRDTVVGDVKVPRGPVVMGLLRHDAVSEAFVERPQAFEPERWLAERGPSEQAKSVKRVSMPFGAGPRICPGRYLALLEMKMAMAVLLGRFDILAVDTPDGRPAQEELSFTMQPVGLTMRLRARG